MLEISDRIKEVRLYLNLTQGDFSEKIGIGQAALSAIEKGIRGITDRNISLICEKFNVSEEWLRTGSGEMFLQPETFSLDEYAQKQGMTELETEIIKAYLNIDISIRKEVIETIKHVILKNSSLEELVLHNDEVAAELAVSKDEMFSSFDKKPQESINSNNRMIK